MQEDKQRRIEDREMKLNEFQKLQNNNNYDLLYFIIL